MPEQSPDLQPSPNAKPRLRLIPLDDTVVFPNMGITLTVESARTSASCSCRATKAST